MNEGRIRYYSYSDGGVIAAIDGDTDTRQYGYDELGRLVKLSSNSRQRFYYSMTSLIDSNCRNLGVWKSKLKSPSEGGMNTVEK
ncbi:hypothetical protein OH492_12020 [Vibrio chagasii]|nr:hypothetical protein [Vibrio chagasii]